MCKSICEDMDCKFKHKHRYGNKEKNECSLDLSDAIMIFKRFLHTSCEIGMGEYIIGTPELTKNLITRLKQQGRM